ncbi:MAG: hypothetical protein K2N23_00970 [Clostridia bacterium]|nr:hypothetical protein [Clostridia bacterium]
MTNLKLSSKMHLFIIISTVLAVIGVAVGLICHFVADGYFNFGAEFKSYNTVEVNYAYVDYSDEKEVMDICDGVFDKAGVSYFAVASGDTSEGGRIIYKFSKGVDEAKLAETVTGIQSEFEKKVETAQSYAAFHSFATQLNGGKVLTFASIAIVVAIVLQFLYFLIRYKVTMAFAAFLANVHNLVIYVSLLAITRVPVGISAVAFGALTVLVTMIACGFIFDRYRRNLKKENFAKLDGDEQTDISVSESFKSILYSVVGIATVAVVIFVMLSISAMSALTILTPALLAIISVASAMYGTVFFVPPVYTRIKRIGDTVKARSKSKK